MNKRKSMTQVMAFLALFGIIIGIIGTGLLIIFSGSQNQQLSPEDIEKFQEMLEAGNINVGTGTEIIGTGSQETLSGVIQDNNTSSGTIQNSEDIADIANTNSGETINN